MIIVVQGSKNFDDYGVFQRAMGVALSSLKDKEVSVWSVGPHKINSYTAAFCNSGENYLKSLGIRITFRRVSQDFVLKHLKDVGYFAYLCKPNENVSQLTARADLDNIEVGVFRY